MIFKYPTPDEVRLREEEEQARILEALRQRCADELRSLRGKDTVSVLVTNNTSEAVRDLVIDELRRAGWKASPFQDGTDQRIQIGYLDDPEGKRLLGLAREKPIDDELMAQHGESVLARLAAEGVRDWSEPELVRCLRHCALPVLCLAIALRFAQQGAPLPSMEAQP